MGCLTNDMNICRTVAATIALLVVSTALGADVTIEKPALKRLFGGFGSQNAEAQLVPQMADEFRDCPDTTYATLGLMSRYFRKGANVLNAKMADPLLRACVLENSDGTMTAAIANLGPRRVITISGWDSFPRLPRLYLYDSAKPYVNRFGDLPRPDRTVSPKGDELHVEIPERGMAFLTTDYIARVPPPVKGVKVAGERLAWTASDDPDHSYYRVYADGRQIASTVATSCGIENAGADFSVVSVDRWGNAGDVVARKGLVVSAEYCDLHAKPWPDLVAALKAAHIGNYSIFLHGDLLFFYLEYYGTDYEADMAALGNTEVMKRWWTHTHPCFERFAIDPDCEFTPDIKQVFFCE